MQLRLFFLPSKAVGTRITETFDFVSPTRVAMWNLRSEIQRLVTTRDNITEADLNDRFVAGSGIHGANLRRACIDTTWASQEEQFAKFLLFELFALHESWCEIITEQLSLPARTKTDLQFPDRPGSAGTPNSFARVIALIAAHRSSVFVHSIQPRLALNRKYAPANLQQLLQCYRYFKELRNFLIHGSQNALARLAAAENTYSALRASDLGLSQKPEYIPSSQGQPPKVSLRGVIGFGEVVLRLVSTMDIALAGSTYAELDFIRRWRVEHGAGSSPVATNDIHRRNNRIGILTKRLGLPLPAITPSFASWLKSKGLVFY
jgi:hypothetical protein